MDSQGEDYQYPFTLPSQSQLEDNLKSKLTIHESIQERNEIWIFIQKKTIVFVFLGVLHFPS